MDNPKGNKTVVRPVLLWLMFAILIVYAGILSVLYAHVAFFAIVLVILSLLLLFAMSNVYKRSIKSTQKDFEEKLHQSEIDQRNQAELNESKTRFLARMSHEVRTPLNVVLGITELQLQKGTFPSDVRESFLQIFRSSKLLLDIINDILDYSKVELGKMEIFNAPYDLYNMIVSTLQLSMIFLGEKHVKFEVNMHKDQYIELIGDSRRIQQVLNNILSNAFKYTKEGSVTLTVAYEETNEDDGVELIFTIKDTGIGMTLEQLGKLGKSEFVRFTSQAHEEVDGTGLGMNIAYQLVSLMGGTLSAESEPGVGTVFTFKIRQKKHTDERLGIFRSKKLKVLDYDLESLEPIPDINYHSLPSSSILVVDDILSNLVVIKEMLSMYGIQVDTAYCGEDAIQLVKRRKGYDMIFMDYMMPGMNGIEVMLRIREMGYGGPIIMLTADVTNNNKELFNGFDDFLSKPIDIHELDSCLKRFIQGINEVNKENVQFSRHLISSFLRDARREIENLSEMLQEKLFDEKKFEDFRIGVHGLKSACAYVGLMELSELALRLELASRDRDSRTLMLQAPLFLQKLSETVAGYANGSLAENEAEPANIDVEFFRSNLLQLAGECEAYSVELAKKTLKLLENKECTVEIKEFLSEIRQLLLHSEYETISEKARTFAKTL